MRQPTQPRPPLESSRPAPPPRPPPPSPPPPPPRPALESSRPAPLILFFRLHPTNGGRAPCPREVELVIAGAAELLQGINLQQHCVQSHNLGVPFNPRKKCV